MIFFDFETLGIESRPRYPPRPVGLAYAIDGTNPRYLAWGHPPGTNNAMAGDAYTILRKGFRGDFGPCVFHHATFDIDVAQVHFGMPFPHDYHDTLFLAFLDDPDAESLSLKPLAKKYLGRQASERDAVFDWIYEHIRVIDANGNKKRVSKSTLGAYIGHAPGDLVGPYASADIEMTARVFRKLHDKVLQRGMGGAYERELALVPVILEMERTGLLVDRRRLGVLQTGLHELRTRYDARIRKNLKVPSDFNVDSGPELGNALQAAGKLRVPTYTATGKQSTAKAVLFETCNDKKLTRLLALRSVTDKYLTGFVTPWIAKADITGGYVHSRFNQVRGTDAGGTRTGRLSSADPNFQNIPSNVEDAKDGDLLRLLIAELAGVGVVDFLGLRDYFLVDPGKLWVAADYVQQELHILAHFEGGQLMAQYLRQPDLDVHQWVRDLIKASTGVDWPRKFIKTVVFMLLYGGGARKLAGMLKLDLDDAMRLRNSVLDALPGLRTLMQETKGEIITWGGRVYPVQPPTMFGGGPDEEPEIATWEYKQLNRQIQGSAADCTKQGMLNVWRALPGCRIALQVHDELGVMVNTREEAAEIARQMANVEFGVPMPATVKISSTTWAKAA